MPAIAHIGIGLAAKRVTPDIHVGLLILAAEFIELIFVSLWVIGLEYPPQTDGPPYAPYTHSILSGLMWSVIAGMFSSIFSKNIRINIFIGLLVFSHTILDMIASPKLAFYPSDTPLPFFFDDSVRFGFGLWKSTTIAAIGEIGIVIAGLFIYFMTKRKLKKQKFSDSGSMTIIT